MNFIKNINLTEKEREAIEIVRKLTNDLFYGLDENETARFDSIMRASWSGDDNPDYSSIEVGICDLSCLLDSLQENINQFNKGIDFN